MCLSLLPTPFLHKDGLWVHRHTVGRDSDLKAQDSKPCSAHCPQPGRLMMRMNFTLYEHMDNVIQVIYAELSGMKHSELHWVKLPDGRT